MDCIVSGILSRALIIIPNGWRLRQESYGVAQFLYSLMCRHGEPNKVMSDQDREFINSVNSHLFRITGVKHIISLAYHPQTNGLVEHFNQTVQRSLEDGKRK